MTGRKRGSIILVILAATLILYLFLGNGSRNRINDYLGWSGISPSCQVQQLVSDQDQNQNGIPDSIDIVNGARQEVVRGTIYDGSYYEGGHPPEGRGACTDVIWRAFKEAGYDLKQLVDNDIKSNPAAYGTTGRSPDPGIDFRRVKNLEVFFARHGQELDTTIIPGQPENLISWQGGDIVVFGGRLEHIGIISDKRGPNGVPLMIHNCGPTAREDDYYLLNWATPMTHHFRFIALQEGSSV